MVGIKTLNNIARLNLKLFQQKMSHIQYKQESHMIMVQLINYCKENCQKSEDIKDLLNEVILMIGYYCVLDQPNQDSLSGLSSNSIIHSLCNFPSQYYLERQKMTVLFPTLICCVFRHDRNLEMLLSETSLQYFVNFLNKEVS